MLFLCVIECTFTNNNTLDAESSGTNNVQIVGDGCDAYRIAFFFLVCWVSSCAQRSTRPTARNHDK